MAGRDGRERTCAAEAFGGLSSDAPSVGRGAVPQAGF